MHKYKLVPRQEGQVFGFFFLSKFIHVFESSPGAFRVRLQVEPEDVAVRQLRSVVP